MSHSSHPLNPWELFFKQGLILEHGLNGFDGLNYASLFIRADTSVVAQVIRLIRSIRGPFTPRGLIFTLHTFSGKWGEVKWFISVYRLAEDGCLL